MGKVIRILAALLVAAFFLIAGNGLQGTLLAVRGDLEGFPLLMVGFLMSAYFAGFIGGCRIAPVMVKRVGHIRSFTALASVASAAALAYALAVHPIIWICLRIVTGFCMAGLYMIIESWINENATNERRGRILSVYRITDLVAATLGQALLAAADPAQFALFAIVSILISLALVPVALTNSAQPRPIASAKLDLKKLFQISPLAAAGCLCVGAANGAFWAVAAVYVQRLGYDIRTVAIFMTTAVIAGALSQWPLGLASDRMDRRIIIIVTASLCAASGALLAFAGGVSGQMLLLGAFAFGFTAMPIFGLCVAHANDRAEPHEYVTLAASLLLLYGVGAVIGPVMAPVAMNFFGPGALFLHTAFTYTALALFGLFRVLVRDPAPRSDRESYVSVPRTSPTVFEIDPRVEAPPKDTEDSAEATRAQN